jgi:inositol phosphorylceramide mannosyltransferase catalytic subunit
MDWEIGNYAFGAAPGHPFLEAVIQNCVRAQGEPSWVEPMMAGAPPLSGSEYFVLNTTGPGLLSRTLAEESKLAEMVTVLFPDDVCEIGSWHTFGDLGVHAMDGSWRSKRSFLPRKFGQYCEAWQLQRLLKQSRKLGRARTMPRLETSH